MEEPIATTSANTSPTTDSNSFDFSSLLNSRSGKGAALGALFAQLLSSYKPAGGVNLGVDMSEMGKIAPRTTNVAPPRYIPYSQYSAMDKVPKMSSQMLSDFGVSSGGLNYVTPKAASFSAVPAMQSTAPLNITSAGSGLSQLKNPTLTPKAENTISPLTGALLGSALGYLTTPTSSGGSSGGTGGGTGGGILDQVYDAAGNIIGKFINGIFKPSTPVNNDSSGYYTPTTPVNNDSSSYYPNVNNNSSSYYTPTVPVNNESSSYYKEGGMATPLMAEGGQVPHYYTYGTPVNPSEVMAQMAQGGQAKQGGLPTHVPTVEGRHDYRSGSRVTGEGDGTSDDIPAMLADGEYVFSADVVSALGNGSTKAGANRLDDMVHQIRARDRSTHPSKLPPDAKSPLQYLKQSRSKKNG